MQQAGNALADFTVNPRVFFISVLALVVGLFASFIAVALIWLIDVVTNVAFFGRFSAEASSPANRRLGLGLILVPVAGSLILGLIARYGSKKIRGHGIPEALEAILLSDIKFQENYRNTTSLQLSDHRGHYSMNRGTT
jgi:chloride channel protein, CIC family